MSEQKPPQHLELHIDNKPYPAPSDQMTGEQILSLVGFSSDKYKLYLEIPGPTPDEEIGPQQLVELREGMQFQTVQKTVIEGSE